ncbi:carbohydrate-binding protein [Pontiella desulfatans]|uniref:carbohydrate-binding protein n=1 Tax=Pontiella desulfatans TaxID=2750659 RepID=UPI0014446937|nr:carbohydrate-binding protein [Pontiella desulfatans]
MAPVAVAADPIEGYIFIANSTGREVLTYDTWLDSFVEMELPFPADVSGIVLSADRTKLFATTTGAEGSLYVIDRYKGGFLATVPVGHYPSAPVASSIAPEVFVCNQFANQVTVVNVESNSVVAEISTRYQPFCMALTPDSTKLVVGHLIPDMPANGAATFPYVSMFDAATRALLHEFALPDGSSGVRGICVSPDGQYAYVTHLLGRYRLPTTHIERGWIWTNAITILDLLGNTVVNTVLLDEVDLGAGNPWPVACTQDGAYLCVATAGSEELIVIDRMGMHDLLAISEPESVPYDLGFLTGLRQYVSLPGKGARSMVVFDRMAFIPEYFSDAVDVVPSIGESVGEAYSVALSEYAFIDPYQFNSFDLPASNAVLFGTGIQLENGGANLGFWNNTNSWPQWTFDVPKDGIYSFYLSASAQGTAGGTFEVLVDGETCAYPDGVVQTTGSWNDYHDYLVAEGAVLTQGTHVVEVRPLAIDNTFLMNLQKLSVVYSEDDLERVGEIIFNDATVCYQQWLSCASCHPDARADGLNWDLGNDGLGGSPRNVKSMLHAHYTPPTTYTAVRPHAYSSVRSGFKFIEFVVVPETYSIATDAYLKSLEPLPSPYLENGGLSVAALRGETLFSAKCAGCHGGEYFTSSAGTGLMWDVGTGGAMDVPSLLESWRTAPYFNHGGAATMREVVEYFVQGSLTEQEIDDLTEYVLSLGSMEDESSEYAAWQWVANAASILPDDADLDGDGVPQIVEYFHGTDPYETNAVPVQRLVNNSGHLRWRYPPRASEGVEAILQCSTNLFHWVDLQTLPYTLDQEFVIPIEDDGRQNFYRVIFR